MQQQIEGTVEVGEMNLETSAVGRPRSSSSLVSCSASHGRESRCRQPADQLGVVGTRFQVSEHGCDRLADDPPTVDCHAVSSAQSQSRLLQRQ